jgi:16S rRNA processing protein RimM
VTGRPVVLGWISGLFGVSGWVKVYSHTRPAENILDYAYWYLGDETGPRRVFDARRQAKTLIAHIADAEGRPIAGRDSAAALAGLNISVDRSQFPVLAEGEYYWCDLIGSAVYNRECVRLGKVARLIETGAHDVLVVQAERERLIPFVVGPIVERVNLAAGRIDVDWLEDA